MTWSLDCAGKKDFSHLQNVHTDSGVHPASYALGREGLFPGVKQQGRDAYHSPPCSAVMNNELYIVFPCILSYCTFLSNRMICLVLWGF